MPEKLPDFPKPTTYESLPVKIQAVQWDGSAEHAGQILNWILEGGGSASYTCDANTARACSGSEANHHLAIRTIEGVMGAGAGWWIIQGTEGEFYPCKDSVFRRKYRQLRIEGALAGLKAQFPATVIMTQGGPPPAPTPAQVARLVGRNGLRRG